MSERDAYEPGVPCWVDTAQPDVEAAVAFYRELFGWEFEAPGAMPDGGSYYVARVRGRDVAGVSSQPAAAPLVPAWTTYVSVESADRTADAVSAAGGTVLVEPFDAAPAGRMAVVADDAGAVLCVWQPETRHGAQVVNEPGAWAMSQLHTPDPDRAKRFYGAVFGWQTEAFGPEITLWRLPGYVGGEPEQPVPRDVIAAMGPAGGDAPPHWSVNFWVHDADATAETAARLGGRLEMAPFEAGGFRNAVIADPQGAVLSVSQKQIG